MDYNKDILNKFIQEVSAAKDISLSEIPCVDLYMDQVTTFFDDKLFDLKRNEEDKILTKTMINNYTKAKILMPAKNKKYTKEHMILLTLIYYLKQNLSISDINEMFNPIINEKSSKYNKASLENIYNNFLEIKKVQQEEFNNSVNSEFELIKNMIKEMETDEEELTELLLMILLLINQANMQKRMAEKLIDNFLKSNL